MEDSRIIALYWQRDETAIDETQKKYGAFCQRLARNILSVPEDAEECVNDTWLRAWNAIPPERPLKLRAWLGRVTRNLALNLWNKNHAKKRYGGMETLLGELDDCIPSPQNIEETVQAKELTACLNAWLYSQTSDDRILFVRRYWYGIPLKELAAGQHMAPARLAERMYRLRLSLKATLEKEGIVL